MFNKIFNSQNLVKINFLIGFSSFSFQIFILNPKQNQISKQIVNLEKKLN